MGSAFFVEASDLDLGVDAEREAALRRDAEYRRDSEIHRHRMRDVR